jgi:membrane associated rhomboid family serine protease
MFLPIRTDSPLRKSPWMNWSIILANVAVFIWQTTAGRGSYARFVLDAADPHLYAYFTYMFLHGGAWHIIGNMLFLYIFGNNVNDKLGNWGYLAFYLAGGVFAGIGFLVLRGTSVIGASGAVAAVTGAYLVLFPRSHITIFYMIFFIGTYDVPCIWFVVFFFLQDIVLQLIGQHLGAQEVAHTAHIAGTMFGFGVCLAMLVANLLPRDQFDIVALIQRWNRRRVYRDIVAQGYDPFGYAPATAGAGGGRRPPPLDPNMERIQDLRGTISEALSQRNLDRAADVYRQLRAVDPQQVLSKQNQVDVANQFAAKGQFGDAAEAYELLLKAYRNIENVGQIELMLGLIYVRYLNRPDLARTHLNAAVAALHSNQELELARAELAKLGA